MLLASMSCEAYFSNEVGLTLCLVQQAQTLHVSGLGDGALPPPVALESDAEPGTLVCHVAPPDAATGQTVVSFHPLYELHNGLPFGIDFRLTPSTLPGKQILGTAACCLLQSAQTASVLHL